MSGLVDRIEDNTRRYQAHQQKKRKNRFYKCSKCKGYYKYKKMAMCNDIVHAICLRCLILVMCKKRVDVIKSYEALEKNDFVV